MLNFQRSTTAPKGYWKGLAAVKKLAAAAKVAADVARKMAHSNTPFGKYISQHHATFRGQSLMSHLPNAVHQADLLFFAS